MIRTCKRCRSTHEYWVHVSQRSISRKVSKSYCRRRIFGNGLVDVSWSFMTSWIVPIICPTIIGQSDSKMIHWTMQRVLIILINQLFRSTNKSECNIFAAISRRTDAITIYEHCHIVWQVLNVIFVMNVSTLILFATILTRESHRSVILMCILSRRFDPDAEQWCSSSVVS